MRRKILSELVQACGTIFVLEDEVLFARDPGACIGGERVHVKRRRSELSLSFVVKVVSESMYSSIRHVIG